MCLRHEYYGRYTQSKISKCHKPLRVSYFPKKSRKRTRISWTNFVAKLFTNIQFTRGELTLRLTRVACLLVCTDLLNSIISCNSFFK